MIVLPEGIYHRFTPDSTNYIHAMRLLKKSQLGLLIIEMSQKLIKWNLESNIEIFYKKKTSK